MVDMYKSIVHSCDTYYYMLANDMGIDNIAAFMGQLGLGSRTGIDIDGESKGVLPSQEWKKQAFQEARTAEMVCRRNHFHRHRPGLQRLYADPAGAGNRDLANNGVVFRRTW
jgi:penicillin-binding protein 2